MSEGPWHIEFIRLKVNLSVIKNVKYIFAEEWGQEGQEVWENGVI